MTTYIALAGGLILSIIALALLAAIRIRLQALVELAVLINQRDYNREQREKDTADRDFDRYMRETR